jgi:hypothetical protein
LLATLWYSCREETIPQDILTPEAMNELLLEFHLLEAKIEQLNLDLDSSRQVYAHFEPQVLAKYGVDSATYKESLEFYLNHPALFHDVYEVVVDSLMVREKYRNID